MRTLAAPKPAFLVGHLPAFGRDPLGFLEHCARDFGDFVPLTFLGRPVLLVNDAEAIEQVLLTRSKSFRKTLGYRTPFMRRLFGEGLLTSEGEFWVRQRRLSQPAFHRDRVASYSNTIVQYTRDMLAAWRSEPSPDGARNVHEEIMKLTTRVVTRTLFDSPVPPEIDEMGEASAVVMRRFSTQWNAFRLLLNLLPTAESRRFKLVMQRLDTYILGLIQQRRAHGKDRGDLLSMLLLSRDDDGSGMNDIQLRDELKTLMVAGLDTTALALSWSLYLLALNPDKQRALQSEINQVAPDKRPLAFADLGQLRYTEAVIKESMRLYPPAWIVGREAIEDCELAGHPVTRGTSVLASQWLKHHDPRHFDRPAEFQPERWLQEMKLPKMAYFPFGGGPRVCIGSAFAMMESILGLATIMQQFSVTAPRDYRVQPFASITLQPKGGITLKLE